MMSTLASMEAITENFHVRDRAGSEFQREATGRPVDTLAGASPKERISCRLPLQACSSRLLGQGYRVRHASRRHMKSRKKRGKEERSSRMAVKLSGPAHSVVTECKNRPHRVQIWGTYS